MRAPSALPAFRHVLVAASLASCSTLALMPAPAWALDGAGFAERLQLAVERNGYAVEYGGVEDAGDGSFTLRDLTISSGKMTDPLRLHQIDITGAREMGEKGLSIEGLSFSGLSYSSAGEDGKEVIVTVESGRGTGLYIADPDDPQAPFFAFPQSTTELGPIEVTIDGNAAFSIDAMRGEATMDEASRTYRSSAETGLITVHTESISDPEARSRLDELGIEEIALSAQFGGLWNMETGRLEITDYRIDAPQFGTFDFKIAFEGFTEAVATELRRTSADAGTAEGQDTDALKAASGKVMETLGSLRIAGASLSYQDHSLAGIMLDQQAQRMGGNRQDIIDLASTMATGMTQALDNPGFSAMLGGAIRTFLSKPESFAVRLEPASPVAVMDMVGAALMAPGSLVDRLGLKVVANE